MLLVIQTHGIVQHPARFLEMVGCLGLVCRKCNRMQCAGTANATSAGFGASVTVQTQNNQ
jgi:hypothetical protein